MHLLLLIQVLVRDKQKESSWCLNLQSTLQHCNFLEGLVVTGRQSTVWDVNKIHQEGQQRSSAVSTSTGAPFRPSASGDVQGFIRLLDPPAVANHCLNKHYKQEAVAALVSRLSTENMFYSLVRLFPFLTFIFEIMNSAVFLSKVQWIRIFHRFGSWWVF